MECDVEIISTLCSQGVFSLLTHTKKITESATITLAISPLQKRLAWNILAGEIFSGLTT